MKRSAETKEESLSKRVKSSQSLLEYKIQLAEEEVTRTQARCDELPERVNDDEDNIEALRNILSSLKYDTCLCVACNTYIYDEDICECEECDAFICTKCVQKCPECANKELSLAKERLENLTRELQEEE